MEEKIQKFIEEGRNVCWTYSDGVKVWIVDGVIQKEEKEEYEVEKDKVTGRYKKVKKNGRK